MTASTTVRDQAIAPIASALDLVVVVNGEVVVHRLPERGQLTIGRGESCDVCIDHPAVSRQHARIHLGPTVSLEDLGSCNGTRVRGLPLPPHHPIPLAPGEMVALNAVFMVVCDAIEPIEPRLCAAPVVPTSVQSRMATLTRLVDRIATSAINVLILGETGVGKEVLAERIHRRSPRAAAPFLKLHCAALAESLLESELFGHERGAFTGAVAAKQGLLETAEGGSVLLDEIGELPMSIQVKLLRVLEERKVLRVGGLKARSIDVRFLAATNRDLAAEVRRGAFRQDLFYRLNGISFSVPPLRERLDELEPLAGRFVDGFWAQHGAAPPAPRLTPAAIACLRAHTWPGNIRELRNVVERAVFLSGGGPITPAYFPDELAALAPAWSPELEGAHVSLVAPVATPVFAPEPTVDMTVPEEPAVPVVLHSEATERDRILDALAACAGNQTRAAVVLGISRRTLVSRLSTLALPRPRRSLSPG
jgi:two-component system response regulator AtoC